MSADLSPPLGSALLSLAAAAVLSAALVAALYPLLLRYALARPNARSSHRRPTPQGGGVAVIAAATVVIAGISFAGGLSGPLPLAVVFASAIALALVGAIDDVRPIEALPRLLLQSAAVLTVLWTLPATAQVLPFLPWWIERALMFVAILWFVNVVNFMDGIDWITVAEVVPVAAGLALVGFAGALPHDATLVAVVLCGAMIGFAPFNRPVARVFLGDVGSLPIGLLLGWLLLLLASGGHLAAALLLPLYYLADATITLLRRLVMGEPVMQAHRRHYYQQAFDRGMSVGKIVGHVFVLNVMLVALAATTLLTPSRLLHAAALAAGCVLVGVVLYRFATARP
ncbi:MAG: glycosyl transferase [Pseudolabrys sp.]|nr:glycosyl transferase [Pseudolabrys sp.]